MNREPIYGRTGPPTDIYGKTGRSNLVEDLDDFSDEETPLTEPIYNGSQRSYMDTKGWDVFRVLPPEQDSGSEATNTRCALLFARICKVFAYFLTLAIVLCGCVLSKFTFLFATSQIRLRKTVEHCNRELERDKQYRAEISIAEQTVWIWVLLLSYLFYEVGVLLRSGRIAFFKTSRKPSWSDFGTVLVFETLSVIGMVLLLIVVLPELDVVRGCMITNCVAIVPLFLSFMSRHSRESHRWKKTIMDVLAFTGQLGGIIIMAVVESQRGNATSWTIPLAVILVSCSWWENYVDRRSPFQFIKRLGKVKDRMRKTRYFTYTFISLWRMILTFMLMLLFLYLTGSNPLNLFSHFFEAVRPHTINVTQIHTPSEFVDIKSGGYLQEVIELRSDNSFPLYFLLAHVVGSYLAYILAKFACKICIQVFSFAFPVLLCGPISVVLLIAACGLRNEDVCWFRGTLPDYLYFECPGGSNFFGEFFTGEFGWVWIIMFVGQTWATYHIFLPQIERLAPTEKIFVTPMYTSFLIDQSLSLNRRRDDEGEVKTEELELDRVGMEDNDISQYYETISIHTESSNANSVKAKTSDSITKIYACATMWHETRSEMMEMMKSIFRMDEDQSARRVAQKYLKVVDGDYYEFETHIFFDDAFEISDVCDDWNQINPYVRTFIECVDEAASYVHQTNIRIKPPKRIPTPYGGRLVYILPGKTKMYVHLKDKGMIRHKKRWSQCMYMYYLLGHRLMELPIPVDRKAVIAENTYILTLDGDIDFQPPAVNLLVDLMKKNKNLGAACGRIHPVGSGPMVWYQLFEYAIGHWLQKATEHMIGCVMCSPGCFSLFRAKALMDDNVMRKYTTKSEEPRHYVQYDQGEDRWLCTLLLQRGYRVEYSAASDAYTHCPEGFSEFFNQRRRWVPSTIANIFDLLMDYKATVKINDNISLPYIWYQCMLMVGTIIGPGTIFLMLVGAFVAAFKISNWYSFYYNLIPIITYTVVCMTCKTNIQLLLSQILSTLYAMVMMAVIVGTALQLGEDGIASPSAVFLISMVGSFFIAACLHPQEFWCIVPGLIYLLCIPSMYLLLIIYSITNLNVVSWGTREGTVKKTKKELAEERKMQALQAKNAKKKGGLFSGLLNRATSSEEPEEGGIDISLGNVLRVMAFTKRQENPDHDLLVKMADILESVDKRMDHLENIVDPNSRQKHRRKSSRMSAHGEILTNLSETGEEINSDDDEESEIHREPRDHLINPFWIEDKLLSRGEVDYLGGLEIQFWKDLIEKYLHPLDSDKAREKKISDGLRELRNKSIFFFSIFNALFVLIVFMLTLHKDMLHVDWPWGVIENITHIEETGETIVTKEYLHLEPIGVVLVFFFFAIILIQFIAMLFHRFGTLAHILASTELNCFTKKEDRLSEEALIEKNAVQIVKEMQKLRGIDGEYDSESASSNRLAHRRTIHMLERNKHKKKAIGTLDVAFKKRFFALNQAGGGGDGGQEAEGKAPQTPILGSKMPMRRETLKALEHRSEEAMIERKQSKMQTLGASNPYNNNKEKHRNTTKLTSATVDRIFANAGALSHSSPGSNTDDDVGVVAGGRSNPLQASIKFKGSALNSNTISSDQHSSSTTSKM